MADENERNRIVAILRDLSPELLEKLASHKILAEFRDETRIKLRELDKETGQIGRALDRVQRDARDLHGRVSGQEAITNGQRVRLEAAERSYGSVNEAIGKISAQQERNSDRISTLEKQDLRSERVIAEIERHARDKPTAPAPNSWADIPLKILIAAMLIGMALGKAGFDPSAWFK